MPVSGAARLLLGLVVVTAMTACVPRTPVESLSVSQQAARLRSACGIAPCLSADLMVRIQPRTGKAETVEVAVRRRPDGLLRLDVSRVDVVAASLVVQPDGALVAWLPRDHAVVRELAHPANPALTPVSGLRLLAQELVYGPLPVDAAIDASEDGGLRLTDPATGLAATLGPLADDDSVAIKRLLGSTGDERLRITYDRWRSFAELRRPERATITVDDGTVLSIRIARLRAVPALAGNLQPSIPEDARVMTLEAWWNAMIPQTATDEAR